MKLIRQIRPSGLKFHLTSHAGGCGHAALRIDHFNNAVTAEGLNAALASVIAYTANRTIENKERFTWRLVSLRGIGQAH